MTEERRNMSGRRGSVIMRWTACFVLAVLLHVAGAAALIANWNTDTDSLAAGPIIMVELAPVAVAPEEKPAELPPGPRQSEVEAKQAPPKPVEDVKHEIKPDPAPERPDALEQVDLKPEPAPEPDVAILPPPKPKDIEEKPKPTPRKRIERSTSPSAAERLAARTAAPSAGTQAHDPRALPDWRSRLVSALQRHKRYPPEARSRRERGVAHLAFSVDRSGRVHGARIVRSSGSATLDRETLALVHRAAPLPPPPSGIGGSRIAIVVPISYSIR